MAAAQNRQVSRREYSSSHPLFYTHWVICTRKGASWSGSPVSALRDGNRPRAESLDTRVFIPPPASSVQNRPRKVGGSLMDPHVRRACSSTQAPPRPRPGPAPDTRTAERSVSLGSTRRPRMEMICSRTSVSDGKSFSKAVNTERQTPVVGSVAGPCRSQVHLQDSSAIVDLPTNCISSPASGHSGHKPGGGGCRRQAGMFGCLFSFEGMYRWI